MTFKKKRTREMVSLSRLSDRIMLEGSKVLNWRRDFREKENKINGFEFRCLYRTVPYRTVPTLCLKFYCRYRCKGFCVSKGDTVVEKKVNETNCLGTDLFSAFE